MITRIVRRRVTKKAGKTPSVKKPTPSKKPGMKPVKKATVARKPSRRKPAPAIPPVTVENAGVAIHTTEVGPVLDSNGVVTIMPVDQAK